MPPESNRSVALLLWVLLAAFCLRVLGQALVAFAGVTWLPPMEAWMSGLLPWPELFVAQLAIIVLFTKVALDLTRDSGWFSIPRPLGGRIVVAFGVVYAGVMATRLAASAFPGWEWLGDPIPVAFHLVLASFLIIAGRWHATGGGRARSDVSRG